MNTAQIRITRITLNSSSVLSAPVPQTSLLMDYEPKIAFDDNGQQHRTKLK